MGRPIAELDIPKRARNALLNAGFTDTDSVRRMPDRHLMRLPNLGALGLKLLREEVPFGLQPEEWALDAYGEEIRGTRKHYHFWLGAEAA